MGSFIKYQSAIYRPSQNNKKTHGFSIICSMMTTLIGTRYKFLRVVGSGTSGRVLLVQDVASNKKGSDDQPLLALKEIRLNELTSGREKAQVRREVVILSKLAHPNIVHYFESFEESAILYIAMEYADGGDLYSFLRIRKPGNYLEESLVLRFFHQLCLALQYLHHRKILHRDLKTKNIFLAKHQTCIKLGDFGISRFLNNTVELAHTVIGTPYYLSPEICESQPYSYKSDIWSLGCVLYEMLALTHPFDAKNMKGLVSKILIADYLPVPKYTI
jgi:NIMA (never in mitosis gene a)-related kinase 1/4/5